jgi:hypothetical protein
MGAADASRSAGSKEGALFTDYYAQQSCIVALVSTMSRGPNIL